MALTWQGNSHGEVMCLHSSHVRYDGHTTEPRFNLKTFSSYEWALQDEAIPSSILFYYLERVFGMWGPFLGTASASLYKCVMYMPPFSFNSKPYKYKQKHKNYSSNFQQVILVRQSSYYASVLILLIYTTCRYFYFFLNSMQKSCLSWLSATGCYQ